jgi:hypothetical protein
MGKKRLSARTENISPIWANTFRPITDYFVHAVSTARVLKRFPYPQSEMEVDKREAKKQMTEERKKKNDHNSE